MIAVRKAIELEETSYVKYQLICMYCRLGRQPAYKDLLADDIYMVACVQRIVRWGNSELYLDFAGAAFHKSKWKVIKQAPVLTAKRINAGDRGKLYVAEVDRETKEKWQDALRRYGAFSGGMIYAGKFKDPLPAGEYEFRLRGEYERDGKKRYWWSLPVTTTVQRVEQQDSNAESMR